MIVWRLEYDPGTGVTALEFGLEEAAEIRIRTNCQEDVQSYKSGLSRVYSGPVSWRSGSLKFRQVGGTLARVRAIAALKVPVKIYFRYHISPALYICAHIIPQTTEQYIAGILSAEDLTVNWIETEEP